MDLLTAQLPQKGVKRLVLICSRYDEGLQDTIFDEEDLKTAHQNTKQSLARIAHKNFTTHLKILEERKVSKDLLAIVEECKTPIFISAMTYNMSQKDMLTYAEDEQLVFNNLNEHGDLTNDMLAEVGNVKAVKKVLNEVIEQKESTLIEKSKSFILIGKSEVKETLAYLSELYSHRISILKSNDHQSLQQEQSELTQQMYDIRTATTAIFTEMFINLEQSKKEGLQALRQASKEYAEIQEHLGTEQQERFRTISTSKWYNPFSWGSSRTESYTVENNYYYIDVADALENLRHFSITSANTVEHVFYQSLDVQQIKRKLLQTVIEYFDTSSTDYSPSYFKLLTEKALQKIEFPVVKFDVSQYVQQLSENFSGEVRDADSKTELRMKLASTVSKLFEEIINQFTLEVSTFE